MLKPLVNLMLAGSVALVGVLAALAAIPLVDIASLQHAILHCQSESLATER